MPLYEFECANCSKKVEIILGLSEVKDKDLFEPVDLEECGQKCSKCGSTKFKRVFSPHAKMQENWSSWQRKS